MHDLWEKITDITVIGNVAAPLPRDKKFLARLFVLFNYSCGNPA